MEETGVVYNRICLSGPYFPKMSYISSAVTLKGRFLTYRICRSELNVAEEKRKKTDPIDLRRKSCLNEKRGR